MLLSSVSQIGIGGGIPNLETGHDIRLGDIVVSRPEGTFGGVKQYDFGKTTVGGVFQPRGSLNVPPRVLRNAMGKLGRIHLRRPCSDRPIFIRVQKTTDYFNQATNTKKGHKPARECDKGQVIERPPREKQDPFIYYGTIASGNQVIKDGETRDRLGKDCLCFEMEAAGLMNDFPCLVIRGICDYADSHKNKRWQYYSARHNQELLNWIFPLEPSVRHSDIRSNRLPDSGTWVLQYNEFLNRLSDPPTIPVLCCYGDPGARKTFITSLVIDKLEEIKASSPNTGLAYVYCDYRDQTLQTTKNITGTILKQLLRLLPRIPEEITAIVRPNIYLLLKSLPKAPSVRLFSTFRKHIEAIVQRLFGHPQTILIKAQESDIRIFIKKSIEEDREKDPGIMNEKLGRDIIENISALNKGMFLRYGFLLPVLHIGSILEARTIRERREALDNLPLNLKEAFGHTVERIQRHPEAAVKLATKLLI
ncbi:MAG: hypothetical protein M1840_007582 [Geoglossum simile]|nr:MAG: hypothetical protein M1840_007582 [Geoglossum simile]